MADLERAVATHRRQSKGGGWGGGGEAGEETREDRKTTDHAAEPGVEMSAVLT